MRWLKFLLLIWISQLWISQLWISKVIAQPVQIEHEGLTLNGNLESSGKDHRRIFLIVHGTWAHSGMEIISSLQSLLSENGQSSLAITLSLGLDDRAGFMTCDSPIAANHGKAAIEIKQWIEHLNEDWAEVIIVGHSRGGNQVALFNQAFPNSKVSRLILIAPMSWNQKQSATAYKDDTGIPLDEVLLAARVAGSDSIKANILQCKDIEVLATSFLSYYASKPNRNTPEILQSVDRPVLVFQGTDDAQAEGYRSQISLVSSNSLVEHYWIDGADHFFRDFYADELVEVLFEWLPE
jgi:pimeloyl-ACP methyl ester carboxylesterase